MDARREDRFSIYGPIKATPLNRPDRVMDCVLLDISATGLKLIAPESLPVDDIISIEAEDHLALADVRYSQPRGDKFTIGCERIHVLNKGSLSREQPKIEQIRLLIEDYRNRIRTGIATPRPDTDAVEAARLDRQILERCGQTENGSAPEKAPVPDQWAAKPLPSSPPYATRDELLEAAAGWVGENWDKIAASPQAGKAGRGEIVDRLSFHLAEKLHARTAPPAQVLPQVLSSAAEVSNPAQPLQTAQSEQPQAAKISEKVERKAPQKAKPRRWRLPAGVAVAAILGWGLSALFWSFGSSGAASHLPSSIARLMTSEQPAAPAPATAVRHAQIKVVEPTWMTATSDGKRLFNKKLAKNDVREIEFSDKALLRVGNARGVEISLDGKPIGPIGGRGQARVVEFSASGFRLLPLN